MKKFIYLVLVLFIAACTPSETIEPRNEDECTCDSVIPNNWWTLLEVHRNSFLYNSNYCNWYDEFRLNPDGTIDIVRVRRIGEGEVTRTQIDGIAKWIGADMGNGTFCGFRVYVDEDTEETFKASYEATACNNTGINNLFKESPLLRLYDELINDPETERIVLNAWVLDEEEGCNIAKSLDSSYFYEIIE